MLHLANKLTFLRILMVPLIIVLLYFEGPLVCLLAAVVFILALITDMLDGYIARNYNDVTNLGKFLDPLADKVLVCSVLIMLATLDWVPAWVTIVIVCRELVITGLRAIAADEGIVLAADKYGKAKTVIQGLALVPLLIHYPFFGLDLQPIGQILLYISLVLAIFSAGNYVYFVFKSSLMDHKS